MRVLVYKAKEGKQDVLVQPSLGQGKPPVLLKGLTRENLKQEVAKAVADATPPVLEIPW